VKQWVVVAEGDLRNAEYTLTMPENCPLGTVCFHAQPTVEKYLKALLLSWSIEFPRIHDIAELRQLLPAEAAFPLTPEEQQRLTDYAVVARYPGEWEEIAQEEAEEAVRLTRMVRDAVRSSLPRGALTN